MTSQRLQEIALKYFAEKGYDGTSLADIAGEIGIKKPSIYAHYPSKMDLFLAVVEAALYDYRQCWRRALDKGVGLPADQRLKAAVEEIGVHFLGDRVKTAFWVRVCVFPPADCPLNVVQAFKTINDEFIAEMTGILSDGMVQGVIRQGSPEVFAQGMFTTMVGFMMQAVASGEGDRDHRQLTRQISECFLTRT